MQVVQGIKFISSGMAAIAFTILSPATSETVKFLVECHAFIYARGNTLQDYAYHLNALGYPVAAKDGIDVNLDEKNIFLSVDSKQRKAEAYNALYTKLPLVLRPRQNCAGGKCKQVEYEPQNFKGTLVVTYDIGNGVMFIKHMVKPATTLQARGGCLFVPLQPD